jgi:hypothetical protein
MRSIFRFAILTLLFGLDVLLCANAQEVSVLRNSGNPMYWVRITNISTGQSFDEPGSAPAFTLPYGGYVIDLISDNGATAYSEFEVIDDSSVDARTVRPVSGADYGFYVPGRRISGQTDECSVLEQAIGLAIGRLGVVKYKLNPGPRDSSGLCGVSRIDAAFGERSDGSVAISVTASDPNLGSLRESENFLRTAPIRILSSGSEALVASGYSETRGLLFLCRDSMISLDDIRQYAGSIRFPSNERPSSRQTGCPFTPSSGYRSSYFRLRLWEVQARIARMPNRVPAESRNHWTEFVPAETIGANVATLKGALSQAESNFKYSIDHLKTYKHESRGNSFLASSSELFRSADVSSVLQSSKREVGSSISDPNLAGLKNYYERKAALIREPQTQFLSTSSALELFSSFLALIERLKTVSNDLSVTLRFDTFPVPETTDTLLTITLNKEKSPSVYSQGGVRNLYRGTYGFCVSKRGFQSFADELDLVDNDGTHLVCNLVKQRVPKEKSDLDSEGPPCPRPEETESTCKQVAR